MKIVLSRKGFDSSYGKVPSPIFPDGRMLSLPIPSPHDSYTFNDIAIDGIDVGEVVHDLTQGNYAISSSVHLDPDLYRHPTLSPPGWRPAFGQTSAAQTHLQKQGIGTGDLFLFFGWFREVERHLGKWRYRRQAPHLHVLFGWLEIGAILPIVKERERCLTDYPSIALHPHFQSPNHYVDPKNTIYIARETSMFSGFDNGPGAGIFPRFDSPLRLTTPGHTRSRWSLPTWFLPTPRRPALSYHGKQDCWTVADGTVHLKSVAKGQEFVLNAEKYPEALPWVNDIVRTHWGR